MKTIERQIRNHEFEIRFDPIEVSTTYGQTCRDPDFFVDGVKVSLGDFKIALDLLSVEAPK